MLIMKSLAKIAAVVSAVTGFVLFCVLAWVDILPYREALNQLEQQNSSHKLENTIAASEADLNRLASCAFIPKEGSDATAQELPPATRTCLLETLPNISTVLGATLASHLAYVWLTEHPDDKAIQELALATISKGRIELLNNKTLYNREQNIAIAHNQSVLLPLFNGREDDADKFFKYSEELNQAELKVLLPQVAHKQEKWMMAAFKN